MSNIIIVGYFYIIINMSRPTTYKMYNDDSHNNNLNNKIIKL